MKEDSNEKRSRKISEEKKKEYDVTRKETMKQLRETKSRLKKEGREYEKTLYFIDAILKRMGISWHEFGSAAGFSNQLISWWQVSDNMKLSNVMACFAARNIAIAPEFSDNAVKTEEMRFDMVDDKFEIHGAIPRKAAETDNSRYVEDCYRDRNRRLWFLAKLIKESGESGRQFAIKAGLSPAVLIRFMENDDIMVRKIYEIASVYGKKVTWRLEAIPEDGKE